MNCPRCKLSLQTEVYEGESLEFCNTCWGFWATAPQLSRILANETYQFKQSERRGILARFAGEAEAGLAALDDTIQCPVCQSAMSRGPFNADCPVVVDTCAEHGIWLDTGEIKALQVFVENR